MKKTFLFSVFFILAISLLVISCGGNKKDKANDSGPAATVEVKIGGMTCTGCEQTIQRSVGKLEGIKSVKANFTEGKAIIEYFPLAADTSKIKDAINGAGYTFQGFTTEIK